MAQHNILAFARDADIKSDIRRTPEVCTQNGQVSACHNASLAATNSDLAAKQEQPIDYCPLCNGKLQPARCKMICTVCNYYMGCSDYV